MWLSGHRAERLRKQALFFMRAKFSAFIRFSVSSLAITRQTTKSDCASSRFERHLLQALVIDLRVRVGDQRLHAEGNAATPAATRQFTTPMP
jgi:hypothetical protein